MCPQSFGFCLGSFLNLVTDDSSTLLDLMPSSVKPPGLNEAPFSIERPGLNEAPRSYLSSFLIEATGLHRPPFSIELPGLR